MKSLYKWALRQVHHPFSWVLFTLLVFIEAFFFMPSSTLLIVFGLERRSLVFVYALLATTASVVGAACAYALGLFLWDSVGHTIVYALISEKTFNLLVHYYASYQVFAVLIVSFLPLPYKAITLTAGFCRIAFIPFLFCCAISRAARFFLLATALWLWGNHIQQILDRYFYYLLWLGIGSLIITGWLVH